MGLCLCGCNKPVKREGWKYNKGHYRKDNTTKECECGCGETINAFDKRGRHRKYKFNHNMKRNWKGGRHTDGKGYMLVYRPDHPYCNNEGYVREHRLIMEEYIGRYLRKDEHIHHVNGDIIDNRIENLQIVTRHEHTSITWTGRKHREESKKRMREVHLGKKLPESVIQKMKGRIPWNKGKKVSNV